MSSYLRPPSDEELVVIDSILKKVLDGATLADDDTAFKIDSALVLRFLRQNDGKEEKTLKAILECIEWRKTTKPYLITFDSVKEWAQEGVSRCAGFTKIGVPICQVRPVSGLKVDIEMRVNYVRWMYEELMRRGYYEIVFIGDFSQVSSAPTSDEKRCRDQIDEMRAKYYPLFETQLYFVAMPWILRAVFAVIVAFMSGAQKEAMHTGLKPKHLLEWIDASQLHENLEGTLPVLKTKNDSGVEVPDVLAMFPQPRTQQQ
ncbi:transmembrane protein, putative [Bodo saltans]|uniref:Transmembrane protein, putative n=1 Tax=Bodo saltans TaxID=75058 RepID=A0A0S4IM09_BODSA|nr:transmembrane protein, putative [Bodo saltans]|eukprot:CUE72561.1 transmembrane protein, putative [Bodo saltans]